MRPQPSGRDGNIRVFQGFQWFSTILTVFTGLTACHSFSRFVPTYPRGVSKSTFAATILFLLAHEEQEDVHSEVIFSIENKTSPTKWGAEYTCGSPLLVDGIWRTQWIFALQAYACVQVHTNVNGTATIKNISNYFFNKNPLIFYRCRKVPVSLKAWILIAN